MKTVLQLYIAFVKIGFTSFGGLSTVPLILEQMTIHNWMSAQDLTNIIGIAEMTPGPLGLNCSTFAGLQTAGAAGCIASAAGVLTPAYTLTLLVSIFYQRFKESKIMTWIMRVVKPITISMIVDVLVTLSLQNYAGDKGPDIVAIAIGIVCFYLIERKKWSVPKVIILAACLGALCFGVAPMLV